MNLFFDTSALIKYFHRERGSDKVETLIDDSKNRIWLSELALIEGLSAFHRRFRMGDLDASRLKIAIEGFESEVQRFRLQPLNSIVLAEARLLLVEKAGVHSLRTLDAIQLASFSLLSDTDWFFVNADIVLDETARMCRYRTLLID